MKYGRVNLVLAGLVNRDGFYFYHFCFVVWLNIIYANFFFFAMEITNYIWLSCRAAMLGGNRQLFPECKKLVQAKKNRMLRTFKMIK